MTGKAYSMKEMKAIVNYLVEHKAFSEIRGRKMWMDYANSKDTTRTWQSLKETFLKRILPDIHNPYYKLSLIEIASFRQGSDIKSKQDNKLDIEPSNEEPIPGTSKENGNNDDQAEDGDKIQEILNDGEEQPGEELKISENLINIRDSTETVVLEHCYHTADDIRKDLENDSEQNQPETAKDDEKQCNTLQQVSSSDCENMDAIDNAIKVSTGQQNNLTEKPIEISDSEEKQGNQRKIANGTDTKERDQNKDNSDNNPKNTSGSILSPNENKEIHEKNKNTTQNSSNTTVDTQLPNNPEEFKQSKKTTNKLSLNNRKRNNRAASEDIQSKRKKNKQTFISDTETTKNSNINEMEMKVCEKTTEENPQEMLPKANNLNMDVDQVITKLDILNEKTNPDEIEVINNDVAVEANIDSQCGQIQVTPDIENPCLKSVNLYQEQFSCTIYSDTDNEHAALNKNEPQMKNIPTQRANENAQMINSSSTDAPQKSVRIVEKKLRENALARAFGFSTCDPRRKRSHSYNKRRPSSHKKVEISSDSSMSSCDTESVVSAPRGNSKRNIKYLKPESHRILSLGEEGTLFVMNGKKIYPVIKNGRAMKTYLTYSSDEKSDNEESYWKLKYVEERKKATDLAKQLENFTKPKESSVVPALSSAVVVQNEIAKTHQIGENETISPTPDANEKSIKIKIINNDKEVQLEGPWSCINPALEQVVQIMRVPENIPAPKSLSRGSSSVGVPISGTSSPSESAKRVADIEKDIFEEIEEIDKAEKEKPEMIYKDDTKTKRKSTRKRLVTTNASNSKKAKNQGTDDSEVSTSRVRRTRNSRRLQEDARDTPDKATNANDANVKMSEIENHEEETLYKFPSPPPQSYRGKRAPPRSRYTIKTARMFSSPDHLSLHSEETQGYLDTDCSPVVCVRRRRRASVTRKCIPKSIPSITEDLSNESFLNAPIQTQTFINSSLSSRVYRSDSYQLLMPKVKHANDLKRIDEFSSNRNSFDDADDNNYCDQSPPTSPVLSIVENLTDSKSFLSHLDENDTTEPRDTITLNNLMPAVTDVTMPLMESNYEVRKNSEDGTKFHFNLEKRSDNIDKVTAKNDDTNTISTKLKNLLIESAKKEAAKAKLVLDEQAERPKAKRRSSTPRKRRSARKALSDTCIVEHTDSCSVNRSQTPIIRITDVDSAPPNVTMKRPAKRRERTKKDIIKVKLPVRRKSDVSKNDACVNDTESGIFLHSLNGSVDLIHNHSDTCCKANECLNRSLEIMEPSPVSIVTVDSETGADDACKCNMDANVALELINQNAQDAADVRVLTSGSRSEISNSLLTDDLSDEITTPRSSKWYLLSEEENSTLQEKRVGCGSNLNQIFPITCAVPDLSTITEASKDNDENSRIGFKV